MGYNEAENVNFSDRSYEVYMSIYIIRRKSANEIGYQIVVYKFGTNSSQNDTKRQM